MRREIVEIGPLFCGKLSLQNSDASTLIFPSMDIFHIFLYEIMGQSLEINRNSRRWEGKLWKLDLCFVISYPSLSILNFSLTDNLRIFNIFLYQIIKEQNLETN